MAHMVSQTPDFRFWVFHSELSCVPVGFFRVVVSLGILPRTAEYVRQLPH